MSYQVGDFREAGKDNRGWFVGQFMQDPAAKTSDVEIKYTALPVGPTEHGLKVSATYECSMLLVGKTRAIVAGNEFEWYAGEFVAIQPGTPNNLVAEIIEPAQIITVKAPCDPLAKTIIEEET